MILLQNFASEDQYSFKRDFSTLYLAVTQNESLELRYQNNLIITAQISNVNKANHGLRAIDI